MNSNMTIPEILDAILPRVGEVNGMTEELYAQVKAVATQAITQAMLDIPEMQSDWEEDIHGTPNPNGKARNELRAEIRSAIKLKGER